MPLVFEEFSKVDHSAVVVNYAFVNLVFPDRLSKVHAILVLFDLGFWQGEFKQLKKAGKEQ
jgi:hypothetical protein